jgi:hypothetical protein
MGGQVFWAGPDGGVPPEWVSLGEVVEDTVTTPAAPDSELLVGWELLKDRPVRARRRCTRAARYAGRIAGLGNVKTPPSLQARIAVLLLRDPRPWPWIPGE